MTKASMTKLAAKTSSNISSSRNKQINFYRTYSLDHVVYQSRLLEDEWIDLDFTWIMFLIILEKMNELIWIYSDMKRMVYFLQR
jgi:intracellular septation protein A